MKNFLGELSIFIKSVLVFMIIYFATRNYVISVIFTGVMFVYFYNTKPKESKVVLTMDGQSKSEADMFIKDLRELTNVLFSNTQQIPVGRSWEVASAIVSTARKIEDRLMEFPADYIIVKELVSDYIPTLNQIICEYNNVISNSISGEQTKKFIQNVEEMLPPFKDAIEKQLDALYENNLVDVSLNMSAMKRSMQLNGLINDFDINNYKQSETK